jgi:hypothetical protein
VADTRPRLVGDRGTPSPHTVVAMGATLYLSRHLLTDVHIPTVASYICETCGQSFQSLPGIRYHYKSKVCSTKREHAASEREAKAETIATKAQQRLKSNSRKQQHSPSTFATTTRPPKRRRRQKDTSMYPQVVLALGYQLVATTYNTQIYERPDTPPTSKQHHPGLTQTEQLDPMLYRADNPDVHCDPDELLEELRRTLEQEQRNTSDVRFGAMYPQVFACLQYKKSLDRKVKKIKKRKAVPAPAAASKKRLKPAPAPAAAIPSYAPNIAAPTLSLTTTNEVPIIDVDALLAEIDSGRYPSMQRIPEQDEDGNDQHGDTCPLCKNGGELVCCDFCPTAVHMPCMLKRFQVPEPDDDDAFLCHKRIGKILTKRRRAEKRAREKLRLEQQQRPVVPKGKEYAHLAQQGTELADLVELLKDARFRLTQCMETTKQNTARRRMLEM